MCKPILSGIVVKKFYRNELASTIEANIPESESRLGGDMEGISEHTF